MDLSFPLPDPAAAASELPPTCVAALLRGRTALPNEVRGPAPRPVAGPVAAVAAVVPGVVPGIAAASLAPLDGAFNAAMAARIARWREP